MLNASRPHGGESVAPIVVKIGGALLEEPALADGAPHPSIAALAALHASERARGGGLVVVHGGGLAVDRHLARLGLETQRIDGIRVTPPEVVEEIVGVLAGRMNTRLVGILAACGALPVGLSLGDGGLCRCAKARRYAFDPGAVGEIVDGDPTIARTLLRGGFLPVVSSIGFSERGEPLNVNADDAAAAIARIVGAEELLLLTDVPGVLDRDGSVIPELDRSAIDRLVAEGVVTGGMIAKVRGALDAAEAAGLPVAIASWKDASRIAAWRTARGAATRVRATAVVAGA